MNCEQVSLLLPWWLNGTLEPEEERLVRDHLDTCAPCRRDLRQTQIAAALHKGHLPAEALVEHALGVTVETAYRALINEHLEHCRSCTAEVELVRSTQLPVDIEPSSQQPQLRPRSSRRQRWFLAALAAPLFALAMALGWLWRGVSQPEGVHPLRAGQGMGSAQLSTLEPTAFQGGLRNKEQEPAELNLAGNTELVVLELLIPQPSVDDAWVAIARQDGTELWRWEGRARGRGSVVLVLKRDLLATGELTIELFRQQEPDQVLSYSILVG